MPDPEDLLSELRFGGAGRPDFSDIRRQARRRRIRRAAMAAVPLSVVAALVVVPRLDSGGGPPAAVVAFAPNGGDGTPAEPPEVLSPVSQMPSTTTESTGPATISTLVAEREIDAPDTEVAAGADPRPGGPGDDPDGRTEVIDEAPTTTSAGPAEEPGPGAGGEPSADGATDGEGAVAAAAGPTTTTVPTLDVDPAPPIEPGRPILDLADLPQAGFAVVQDGTTVLADADGVVLGHLPTSTSGLTFGRPRPVLAADAVTGCQVAEARRTLRVEICPRHVREHGATYDSREVRLSRIDAPSIVVTTPIGRDWYRDPSRPVLGQWRTATVSPDARWMALEWAGGCGSLDAFVVDLEGDELVSATGTEWPVSPEAEVLGWVDDDSLLLHLLDGPCSAMTATPGVYRYRPGDGTLVQLVATDRDATAQLWSQTPVDQ